MRFLIAKLSRQMCQQSGAKQECILSHVTFAHPVLLYRLCFMFTVVLSAWKYGSVFVKHKTTIQSFP